MSKLVALHEGQAVTTTTVIAKGTKNEHASVIKLVRSYQTDLEVFGRVDFKSTRQERGGHPVEYAILNERQATLLITYMRNNDVVREFKMQLVREFYELAEAARRPQPDPTHTLPKNPMLAMLVQQAMELDRVEQEVVAVKQQANQLMQQHDEMEHRIAAVELQHRSGVPIGYLSRSQAHQLYGRGLSKDIFHAALAKLGIPTKSYIHTTEDGYEVATFAYLDDMISEAVQHFIDDAQQATPKTCVSPMLDGKMFRFTKQQPELTCH